MLKFNDIEIIKSKYITFSNYWFKKIEKKYNLDETIKLKVQHGLNMSELVSNSTLKSNLFNESYIDSSKIEGLLHDVGRFPQYYQVGTLKDNILNEKLNFLDHGRYGAYYLSKNNKELLRYFIGETKEYDEILIEIIKEHTTILNKNYRFKIEELTNIFNKYDINEIINSNEEMINKLITLKLLILKEQDSLEILYNISNGLLNPKISNEKEYYINDTIWSLFINGKYINMQELKEKGLWTLNAGFLLRYSLIYNNVNFKSTLNKLIEDDIITKVYNNQVPSDNKDIRLTKSYEYINLLVKNLIENSNDIITDEVRNEAKIKTLKQMKM